MKLTLKQARLMSEKTQHDIADFLGVHYQTYRKIERNPDCATVEQAKKISAFLGVSHNDIFFDDVGKNETNEKK